MRNSQLALVAITALALALGACGATDDPANDIAAEDANAMMNVEELPPVEPATNEVDETPTAEERQSEPAAKPSTPASTAMKPTPAPAVPKPAEQAADPNCAPEHRAAGHC